jgi:ligand-binding SRPBCC domain-containing protein
MQTFTIETWVAAPIECCFDASRDLDLHRKTFAESNERAVAGRLTGLIELGEEVTWRGRHFGITQHFTSRITRFDRPHHFRDEMQRGAFRSFTHDHFFVEREGGTAMTDLVSFAAPLGVLGKVVERLVLRRYLERLLRARCHIIKQTVEAEMSLRRSSAKP